MTALFPGALEGREACGAPRTASRPGRFLLGILLLPGGLVMALGLAIAWAGLVLLLPGLRRMTAAMGGPAVAPVQPHGEQDEPRPRVPWAACGERGASTGQPPTWLAPPSREAH